MGKDMKKALPKEVTLGRQKAGSMEPHMGQEPDLSWAAIWDLLLHGDDSSHPPQTKNRAKKIKTLDSLIKMIESFPTDDPTNDQLQDDLCRIRGKVKQVCSMLNIQPDFRINYENSGLSF